MRRRPGDALLIATAAEESSSESANDEDSRGCSGLHLRILLVCTCFVGCLAVVFLVAPSSPMGRNKYLREITTAQVHTMEEFLLTKKHGSVDSLLNWCHFNVRPTAFRTGSDTVIFVFEVGNCDSSFVVFKWRHTASDSGRLHGSVSCGLQGGTTTGSLHSTCTVLPHSHSHSDQATKRTFHVTLANEHILGAEYAIIVMQPGSAPGLPEHVELRTRWIPFGNPRSIPVQHSLILPAAHTYDTAAFTAFVVSDPQSGAPMFRRGLRQIAASLPDVDMLIHVGDAVQTPSIEREWHSYLFGPLEEFELGQRVPTLYTRGNHDIGGGFLHFYLPSPPFYTYTEAGIFWMVLDSNSNSEEQRQFISTELASDGYQAAKFRIIVCHIPPFVEYWEPNAWERGEKHWGEHIREEWVPLFEKAGVDLVLGGHSHIYQRGQKNGIIYVVAGGAGGELEDTKLNHVKDYGMYEVTRAQHHYLKMTASRCTSSKASDYCLHLHAVGIGSGEIFDSLSIHSSGSHGSS